ncbi:conserved hypothetical protein [Ixodes scapularis]|uniref:Uncharacterized protein n=1 Tax=Ixodes scapularis TaxID=6945 RepID=B7Q7A9_IXOSC|nr:conserved hypothetical protein [Ixodes scapularis]|eukprot:XP_002403858.1 conserved hypothetical protein [Ixodes scapularis]
MLQLLCAAPTCRTAGRLEDHPIALSSKRGEGPISRAIGRRTMPPPRRFKLGRPPVASKLPALCAPLQLVPEESCEPARARGAIAAASGVGRRPVSKLGRRRAGPRSRTGTTPSSSTASPRRTALGRRRPAPAADTVHGLP